MKYSIVIPAYNSGKWIKNLLEQLQNVMNSFKEDYEIIVVNDSSPDKETWINLRNYAMNHQKIHAINLSFNVGQIKALLCGLKKSSGDFVITMDDDFQHDPNDITKLIHAINEYKDCECVIAEYPQKHHNLIRKLGSKFINNLYFHIYRKPKDITSTSFRIFTQSVCDRICSYQSAHPQFGPILFSVSKDIKTVKIEHHDRKFGESGYSLKKMIDETLITIVSGSAIPFNFLMLIGIISNLILILVVLIYIFLSTLSIVCFKPYILLLLILLFFCGITIFSIGLIGRYICRMMEELIGLRDVKILNEIQDGAEII